MLPRVRTIIIHGHDKAWPSRIYAHSATYGLPLVEMTRIINLKSKVFVLKV